MRNIKVSWHVTITGTPGYSLYNPSILVDKIREYGDRITRIDQVVNEWFGDWDSDDNPRHYVELARTDITDVTLRLVAA